MDVIIFIVQKLNNHFDIFQIFTLGKFYTAFTRLKAKNVVHITQYMVKNILSLLFKNCRHDKSIPFLHRCIYRMFYDYFRRLIPFHDLCMFRIPLQVPSQVRL